MLLCVKSAVTVSESILTFSETNRKSGTELAKMYDNFIFFNLLLLVDCCTIMDVNDKAKLLLR